MDFALGCISLPPQCSATPNPSFLLIDDDIRTLESLHSLLEGRGFNMTLATSGAEAQTHLLEKPYDIVLLDLNLGDMHGLDIMDFINEHQIDVTTIVLSGETNIESAIGALQRGAYGYLRKPYPSEQLLNKIENALEKRALEERNRQIAVRLEYSEKIYRNLVDNSPDIIYTLNRDGCFTFVNERAQQVLGYTQDELLGKHYSIIVHEDDQPRAQYVFNERRTSNRASRNVELRLRGKHLDDEELTFDQSMMTISFNSMGMYTSEDERGRHEYHGTYVVARDVTERKRAEELITYQAYHDILTDLPNRILFNEQLHLSIIQARRTQIKLAVMLINLHRFKIVNDTLGHSKGDELLRQVAKRLKSCLCEGGLLARHGGDEFAIIVPCIKNRQEAATQAGEILKCMKKPFLLDGQEAFISARIGIAVYPSDGDDATELVRLADIAVTQMKLEGKDGYLFYDLSMQNASQEKAEKEKSLRLAVENNELEMYYQPQVEFTTRKIIGAEALMRWNHPVRGLLSAGLFLPFAEENGLMPLLSEWMLEAVCKDMSTMIKAGCPPIRVAINISPNALDHSDLFEHIQESLENYAIPPKQFEVEITENICIRNPQYAIEQLNKLSQLGISVAIDDFGTGYSSLAYLHRFPINTIKIDQMFVREIQSVDGHFPVALAIVSIARGLGLNLIAEGVETDAQACYLKKSGCESMQGYHFHKPMPSQSLIDLLKKQAA
ncbi:MAG: EAL domain-containing protein [Oxalobacter sp.]|nr:MAG: EAL domain-containing protein [Oxalobacter sp.]